VDDAFLSKISITAGSKALELVRSGEGLWRFEKPSLGYALLEAPLAGAALAPEGGRPPEGGVKGLINEIRRIHVIEPENFVPLGQGSLADYGLDDKQALRILVVSKEDLNKKETTSEEIVVGQRTIIKDKETKTETEMVYVRVAGDTAVALVPVS